jgi:hypothetical protein
MKLLNQRRLPNGAKIQMRQMGSTYCVEAKLPRKQIEVSQDFAQWLDADRMFYQQINKLARA